jgi:hypothetical protein
MSGNFTVYLTNDTGGDKQIKYTGSGTRWDVDTFYGNLQYEFQTRTGGVGNYMDEGIPIKYNTPTNYLFGRIENNDPEPWFIDNETIKYLQGGSIETTGWTRSVGSAIGIVRVEYTIGTDFISSDIGKTVTTTTDGDSGKLLDFDGTYAYIRPDDSTAGNSFDATTPSDTITVTGGSAASVTQVAASDTGETVWNNIYTIGTIEDNTRICVAQGSNQIGGERAVLTNWWGDGHLDILVRTKDTEIGFVESRLFIYLRQPTTLYDFFEQDFGNSSTGTRTAVAVSTSGDTNALNGYRSLPVTSATTAFTVGETVTGQTTGAVGVVTENTGNPTTSFEYYLVGDAVTDFNAAENLTGSVAGANGRANGAASNVNAATYTDVTVTFGLNQTFDIDDDSTNEDYSVVINCNNRPLSEVYERLKYITRRGETSALGGIEGQQYRGLDLYQEYQTLTGALAAGDFVYQGASLPYDGTGYIAAHDTTNKYVMIHSTGGTLNGSGPSPNDFRKDGSNKIDFSISGNPNDIFSSPIESPFGAYVGGRFFGARGVVLDNVASADRNNYEVITNQGVTKAEPITALTLITVLDGSTQLPIENARVILEASDGTGDLGYQDSVTITRSGSTATVSHTSHPYEIGDKVVIRGDTSTENEYTGVQTITAITANSYDYTVTGTPTTPASGTITSTGVILEGLTDVNGEISDARTYTLNQPVIGHARKSTSSPFYRTSTISGTIDKTTGYTQTVGLILDE